MGNPYLPNYEYVPDGEPYVFGDRLYVYGSHDEANNPNFCVGDYVVWSAPTNDLSDWKYEGVSYKKTDDPHNKDSKHTLFAPDVVRGKDGKYYLYYCLNFAEEFGVAKSDKPEGPFEFYGHIKNKNGEIFRDFFPYDPSVFIDDDGKIYLYYGFSAHFMKGSFGKITPSPGCMVIELDEDMLTVKTEAKMCLSGSEDYSISGTNFSEGHYYFEAPSMRKINGMYYLVYSSQSQHELCYAISKYPDRDFVYGGVIISNGDIGLNGNKKAVNYTGTNHGGLVEINEEWYIFYHRNTHGLTTSRQGCAEKIFIEDSGEIKQVGVSSYGLRNKAFKNIGSYSAYLACYLEKRDSEIKMQIFQDFKNDEPHFYEEIIDNKYEHYISNITDKTLWGYNAFELSENVSFSLEVKGNAKGEIFISSDREGKNKIGNVLLDINNNDWVNISVNLKNISNIEKLYFEFNGIGSFKFKSINFM